MPGLTYLIDRMADMVISVISPEHSNPSPPPYPTPPPTPPPPPPPVNRFVRDGARPPTYSRTNNKPHPSSSSLPNPTSNSHSSSWRGFFNGSRPRKSVHWPDKSPHNTHRFTVHHHRRNKIYRPSNNTNSNDSRNYESQRYPHAWYSHPRGPHRPPQPHHRDHIPHRPILRPPTTLDNEILIRNLWMMNTLAEQRLAYMYEFLSGVLPVGDDVLDIMYQAGEMVMREEAARRAVSMVGRSRRDGGSSRSRPTLVPVSASAHGRGEYGYRGISRVRPRSVPPPLQRSRLESFSGTEETIEEMSEEEYNY